MLRLTYIVYTCLYINKKKLLSTTIEQCGAQCLPSPCTCGLNQLTSMPPAHDEQANDASRTEDVMIRKGIPPSYQSSHLNESPTIFNQSHGCSFRISFTLYCSSFTKHEFHCSVLTICIRINLSNLGASSLTSKINNLIKHAAFICEPTI